MMDADTGIEMAANESETASTQSEESNSSDTQESSQQSTQQEPDITQTQAFSHRLKEMTQKAIDDEYARLYSGHDIYSKADYDARIAKQQAEEEAANRGLDPEFYQEFTSMKSKLNTLEQEKSMIEQDNRLANDAVDGKFYQDNKGQIQQIARDGGVDFQTALFYYKSQKFNELSAELEKVKNATTKNQQNTQASMGSATGQGTIANDHISKDTFELNKSNPKWVQDNLDSLKKSMKKW